MAEITYGGPDKALVTSLNQARKATADKPLFFVMVLKGGSDGVLIVQRKKIPEAKIQAAKKVCGGSAVIRGVCFAEEGQLVFETPKPPGSTWAKVAKSIAKTAGAVIAPVFRLGRDPDAVAEPEGEPGESEGGEETPVVTAVAANPELQRWNERVDQLESKVKAYVAGGADDARDVALLFSQAKLHGRKGEFAAGHDLLNQVQQHLGAATDGADEEGQARLYAQRRKALEPRVLAALKANHGDVSKIRAVFAFVQEKGDAGEYARALAALDNLEKLLPPPGASTSTPSARVEKPASPKPVSNVVFQQSRLAWDTVRKKTHTDIEALKAAILKESERDQRLSLIRAGLSRLDRILERLDTRLSDKLDEALNAPTPEQRQHLNGEASRIVGEYRGFVETEPLMEMIDDNGFLPLTVRKSLLSTLDVLADKLGA